MSRSSNINLIVRDNRVELLLGFAQSGNIVKNDFRLLPPERGNNVGRVFAGVWPRMVQDTIWIALRCSGSAVFLFSMHPMSA